MLDIAELVLEKTRGISRYLAETRQIAPSFADGYPSSGMQLSPALEADRNMLLVAIEELRDLLLGPDQVMRHRGESHRDLVSLHFIYRHGIASKANHTGMTSYSDMAQRINLPEGTVQRMLQHAMVHHRVFVEQSDKKGNLGVAHNAVSRALQGDSDLRDFLGVATDELWPAAVKTVEAIDKWKDSEDPSHAGFPMAHRSPDSIYKQLAQHPERARRFAASMSAYSCSWLYSPQHLVNGYPWSSLPAGSTIVDVGGSLGSTTIPIIGAYPHLDLVVQDIPEVASRGTKQERVRFMAHDFFAEQPVRAAVYFFRFIFHNWADRYAVLILRALIPALTDGARVMVCEHCIPALSDRGKARQLKDGLGMDMTQLIIQNGRERNEGQWRALFEQADHRFRFNGARSLEGSALSVMEATWIADS